ncbi:MAG: 6,7-dimethyl-8-ribityllumazine synthase [Maricaulaceae bacterium]|jgi:6,7-dimethyl-8-ribityllumazine synthase
MTSTDKPVLIVSAPYYADIVADLEAGAERALTATGLTFERIEVPGAFEIPGAIAAASASGRYAGFLALGCVIRGQTSHYDHICEEIARALMDFAVKDRLAIGFGVLTVENETQARERAALAPGGRDKGGEAARALAAMIAVHAKYDERLG